MNRDRLLRSLIGGTLLLGVAGVTLMRVEEEIADERKVRTLREEIVLNRDAIEAIRSDKRSGTWVELEDGTARAEWLVDETNDSWAARAMFAASLADQMNGRAR